MDIRKLMNIFEKNIFYENITIEGAIVLDKNMNVLYKKRWTPDYPRDIYSNTKSFTSIAAGMACSEGIIDLKTRFGDIIKSERNYDSKINDITLENFLTMSSGFNAPYLMYFDRREGHGAEDYLTYMLNEKVVTSSGSSFCYSSADAILAGIMIEKVVGTSLKEYLYKNLFSKIGINFPIWEGDLIGHTCGASGLIIRLEEMAKLGVVVLNKGMINGNRIINESWYERAFYPHFRMENNIWNMGYGYLWRILTDKSIYMATGVFGQETFVSPSEEIVFSVQCKEETNSAKLNAIINECIIDNI